jgi:diaminopimelate epimerase
VIREFSKMNGAGNDFVMIDDMNDELELSAEQVAWLCDRHFGIGADGVILVKPSPRPECAAYMDYYNNDGTKAQMCGNGVRCFSKFLVDRKIVDPSDGKYVADTLSGPKPISFELDDNGKLVRACVDMGEPALEKSQIPTALPDADTSFGRAVVERPVRAGDLTLDFTCVSMGNPHAVTFVNDPLSCAVEKYGPIVEKSSLFPEGTNVEFARVCGDKITMRVWERGCGETLACGTGCCATAVAAHITGRAPRQVTVKVLGGEIDIDWRGDNHVYMTGPAKESFTGTVDIA